MKYSTVVAIATVAAASPISNRAAIPNENEASKLLYNRNTGAVANEFAEGGCKDKIFIFSRGSTEAGNMGTEVGPEVSDGLKQAFGEANAATQGVDYAAALSTNFLPGGADPAGIKVMTDMINKAANQCPTSTILIGGYSQGAAMVHQTVKALDPTVQSRIAGAVTFGDTQNQQDGGQIPGLPQSKTKIICNEGDLVCDGTLVITAAHLAYTPRTAEGVQFLVGAAAQGS